LKGSVNFKYEKNLKTLPSYIILIAYTAHNIVCIKNIQLGEKTHTTKVQAENLEAAEI